MLIRKKPPRPHAPGEPILHENHRRPVSRRDFISAGLLSAPAVVMAPAWLGALLKPGTARGALASDIQSLLTECGVTGPGGKVPFICFDLAGGANLVGSEVVVGVSGGQANFLSTAGYGKLGLPGNMVPTSSAFVNNSLGLLWHSDGAILRGILSKVSAATAAGTNGAVIPALSDNDTGTNPHNPMYGIAKVGAKGDLLTLVGTQSTVSGGNSAAPPDLGGVMIDASLQPSTIVRPSDAIGLVSTGGATADPVAVAVLESQERISGGTAFQSGATTDPDSDFTGVLSAAEVQFYADSTADAKLKEQVRCNYVRSAYNADEFGTPSAFDPRQDAKITSGIFTAAEIDGDSDIAKTATVMKLVLNKHAGAGTITLGGFDYHDSTRATGEMRNFKAGQMIGAVLEYAQRVSSPVMIYVFSDGSLTSSSMIDSSADGRGKLAWQGDASSAAATFFLVYNPGGRPVPRNGAASQQIGYFSADGSVVSTSSPAANSVVQLVETVVLNYMGLHNGLEGSFSTLFPSQGLGSPSSQASLIAFEPIA